MSGRILACMVGVLLFSAASMATPLPFGGLMLFDAEKVEVMAEGVKRVKVEDYNYAKFKKPKKSTVLVQDVAYPYAMGTVDLEIELLDQGDAKIALDLIVEQDGKTKRLSPAMMNGKHLKDSGKRVRLWVRFEGLPEGQADARIGLAVEGLDYIRRVRVLPKQPKSVWRQVDRYPLTEK